MNILKLNKSKSLFCIPGENYKVADRTFYRKWAWLRSISFWNPSFHNPRSATEEEEEEQEEEQQEDTEDSGGESGDDKCVVCGEKEEDDVDIEDWVACEMCSQWIHSKCIPSNHPYSISHADFHCHICLQ